MPKIDRIKSQIELYSKIFLIVMTSLFAGVGWLLTSYNNIETLLLFFVTILGISLFFVGILLFQRITKLQEDLENE